LKGAYCRTLLVHIFSNENIERRSRKKFEKSSDGLFNKYRNQVMIPYSTNVLIKSLLIEYLDDVGHPNYRRLMASLLTRYW